MIKLIAMITMLVDHIGAVFYPNALWMRIIGRVSFPLFAWGIAMGSRWTRDWKRYAARLLALALLTQIPYSLLFQNGYWNICFTLLSGLLVLKLLQIPNRLFG
ncbi:MAG TPA: conjugal transfer protein TraX, partial [Clostridiales bacterium]|nr:conjugal transfer protein TraX [Clostridiales bacterium]